MNEIEICKICGEPITEDDEKIYCPDCGVPMHKDCYEMNGECPDHEEHSKQTYREDNSEKHNSGRRRLFMSGDGCEICGKPFEEGEERVYCPDCGASMHRLCYNMTHRCPYEDLHTPRPVFNGASMAASVRKSVCDRCGNDLDNGEEKVYCPVCGTPVHKHCWEEYPSCPNEDKHVSGYDWEKEHAAPVPKHQASDDQIDNKLDPMMPIMSLESFSDQILSRPIKSSQDGEELTCCGVKQKELLYFLGIHKLSTPRFFSLFMNMANSGRHVSVNISAWLFMPFYQFYRRMTGPAVIMTLATFILTVPTVITQIVYFSDPGALDMNNNLITASNITTYIMFILRIILLLFNDYLYMRWSVNKILELRERYKDASDDEYQAALENHGNPRMMYVLVGIGLLTGLVYILDLFLSAAGFIP